MKRELITRKSEVLDKDMSLIVYGEGGYPVIAFQAQNSKCNNFEDFGMVETLAPYIEDGTIQLFSVDNNDEESWSDTYGDNTWRADRQEAYFRHVTDELVPFVHETNGTERRPLAVGCSMGATHAALAALRRPDLFQGCIALSGVYDARYFFGDWMNEVLYDNSIVNFLPNMPADHPYVKLYGERQIVMCVGQGAWEDQGIRDLRIIADACHEKGIDAWCDFWGYDVNHDWPWWKKQITYFLPIVLDDMSKTLEAEGEPSKPVTKAKRTARKAAGAAKATTKKAATSARKTAGKATSAVKKAATKTAAGAKAAAAKVEADAEKVAADAKAVAAEAKTAGKRASGKAQAATKAAAAKVEADAEKVAADAKAVAAEAKTAGKRATAGAKAATKKVETSAQRTAGTAKATARKAGAEAEKVADEVKDAAKKTAAKAKATTRKAATKAKATTSKAAGKVEAAAEKVADQTKAVAKRATTRRASTKGSAAKGASSK